MAEICFILSSFERGGITRSIIELSKELANYTSLEFAFFENRTSIDNSLIQGTSLQIPAPTYYFQKVFVGVKRYRAMSKYLNREKCKVLICADVSTSLLGWIFSIFHPKLKVIGSCHVGKRLLTFQDRLIIRFIFPRLSDVVVPSENVARELLGIQKRSVIKVIYNMLPLSACENPWPKPDLVEDFFLYFLIGSTSFGAE